MALKNVSVFWIEDQLNEFIEDTWEVLKDELARRGFDLEGDRPYEAKTVAAAERMLHERNTLQASRPDVILLDLMLPQDAEDEKRKRVDLDAGYLIWIGIRILKKWPLLAEVPIIVITARGCPEYMDQVIGGGATRWLSKPVDPTSVAVAIEELLAERDSKKPQGTR